MWPNCSCSGLNNGIQLHLIFTIQCTFSTDTICHMMRTVDVMDFCADNPTALAHTSPDVQKLLESEEDWGFSVIDLELLTKRR